jgi:hypothetical protein
MSLDLTVSRQCCSIFNLSFSVNVGGIDSLVDVDFNILKFFSKHLIFHRTMCDVAKVILWC